MVDGKTSVIVGAGVIGAATAYHLKRMDPHRTVLLIDMNRRIGEGNTAKSAALYRNIFSSKASRSLAGSSIKYYLTLGDEVQINPIGYLWLFSEAQWRSSASAVGTLEPKRDGLEFLDTDRISSILRIDPLAKGPFPGIGKGIYGRMCGSLSGMALAQHYGEEFKELGGEIVTDRKVVSVELSGKGVCHAPWTDVSALSVSDARGERYELDDLIFATGAWTHEMLSGIGIFSGVLPKKRQLFGLRLDEPQQMIGGSDPAHVPALILPAGGTYIKPMLERKMLLVGSADDLGRPYSLEDSGPENAYFERAIEPVLNHYFPHLVDYEMKLKWSGQYSYHWPDKNPVVESVKNIIWASGTSGSGIMKGDAIGRLAASKVLGLADAELFDGGTIPVQNLSLRKRSVENERFVI